MSRDILPYAERMKWFHEARFGMFIHWGLYSLLGRGEWVMFNERIRADEYAKLADRFAPDRYDPDAWAALAAEAGMKYMVLTTRHHDGFCLYDSEVSDFTSVKTAAGRDLVAEYVEACRKAGLKVGLYYSLMDWRFKGYWEPDKYPDSAEAMVGQCHDQVTELMSNYGRIDVLWYDGCWVAHGAADVGDIGEFWRADELNANARKLQPHILINNRSGTQEDLDTPEQHVKASEPGRGWESCMTIGDSCGWGYVRHNPNFKTLPTLLQTLVNAAVGEGNLLLNVGPRPDGTIRPEETQLLREMGDWLDVNGEAIYGSQRCELSGGIVGQWTRKGASGYLHVFRWPGEEAVCPYVVGEPTAATLLATGEPVKVRMECNGRLVISGLPSEPPHPAVNVIRVDFRDVPKLLDDAGRREAWLTGDA